MTLLEKQTEQTDQVVWESLSEALALTINDPLRDLLTHTGSLTRRLRDLCDGGFRLQLLGEQD